MGSRAAEWAPAWATQTSWSGQCLLEPYAPWVVTDSRQPEVAWLQTLRPGDSQLRLTP